MNDLCVDIFFQLGHVDAFNCALCADRHKNRRFNYSMISGNQTRPCI